MTKLSGKGSFGHIVFLGHVLTNTYEHRLYCTAAAVLVACTTLSDTCAYIVIIIIVVVVIN